MKMFRKFSRIACAIIPIFPPFAAVALHYKVIPLVSDLNPSAPNKDPNLINPWGLFFVPNENLWVADNGSNVSTVYSPSGSIINFVIHAKTSPTGARFNSSSTDFLINGIAHAQFLFSTEAGTILGFNNSVLPNDTVIVADQSKGKAIYKGLEVVKMCCDQSFLYATDFYNSRIDRFDTYFQKTGMFHDSRIPKGYAPFNIKNIDCRLYVTYAKQKPPENRDDDPGRGHGYVDIFSLSGTFIKRLISQGNLNSPWGLALAPCNFGEFSEALLVGNFGDGKINAYDPLTGLFLGQLTDANNQPIVIEGLWSLEFDERGVLYFTAGPNDKSNGFIGTISPLP